MKTTTFILLLALAATISMVISAPARSPYHLTKNQLGQTGIRRPITIKAGEQSSGYIGQNQPQLKTIGVGIDRNMRVAAGKRRYPDDDYDKGRR